MRPEFERLQLIEQQLLGGLAALPAADWHLRQLLDGDLATDAAVQQRLYDGLRRAGRQQLRRELAAVHARLYGPRPAGWAHWFRRMAAWLRASRALSGSWGF